MSDLVVLGLDGTLGGGSSVLVGATLAAVLVCSGLPMCYQWCLGLLPETYVTGTLLGLESM